MKATINLIEGVHFSASADSGHQVLIDGSPEFGGENKGSRPMELVLMGMGGCTAFDVILILRKARQKVTNCRLELSAERAESVPKVFTKIHVHFVVTGHCLRESAVERAVKLSAETYCSASAMLGKTAEITHDYEIIEAGN